MILDTLLFTPSKIHDLPPSPAKEKLLKVLDIPPEDLLQDIINYWCYKNLGSAPMNEMRFDGYGPILKRITPKTSDVDEFHKMMSSYLKRLV